MVRGAHCLIEIGVNHVTVKPMQKLSSALAVQEEPTRLQISIVTHYLFNLLQIGQIITIQQSDGTAVVEMDYSVALDILHSFGFEDVAREPSTPQSWGRRATIGNTFLAPICKIGKLITDGHKVACDLKTQWCLNRVHTPY